MSDRAYRVDTQCARPPLEPPSTTAPLSPPLHASVVYRIGSLDEVDALYERAQSGYIYARDDHPNLTQLCGKIARIEGAEAAWAASSGMAAEAAPLLATLSSGDHIAVADGVYGKTGRLAAELARFGVLAARFDATRPETLEAVIGPATRWVIAETLSNPLVRVCEIAGLADIAHRVGAKLLIDHTFAPLLCQPLALGADVVTHSATKLLGGHSDLTLGVVASRAAEIEAIARASSTFGMTANPYECWLCLRGLATLPVRVYRACETALILAQSLESRLGAGRVHYPGLPSHPDHNRARTLFQRGFGTIITIDLGDRATADRFIRAIAPSIPFAPSLGDTATTLSHPATTSHRGQSAEDWRRQGITPGLVRLSIGLEDAADLWTELDAALG